MVPHGQPDYGIDKKRYKVSLWVRLPVTSSISSRPNVFGWMSVNLMMSSSSGSLAFQAGTIFTCKVNQYRVAQLQHRTECDYPYGCNKKRSQKSQPKWRTPRYIAGNQEEEEDLSLSFSCSSCSCSSCSRSSVSSLSFSSSLSPFPLPPPSPLR